MSIPITHANETEHRRKMAMQINLLIPVVKSVTLATSSTTTTVTDEKMGKAKTVQLIPTNANAAAENIHLSTKNDGSFVLTHTSAGTTRTFDYFIVG